MLTTLRGDRFGVNPDLIEEIRANGANCVVGMITGRSYTAAEDVDTVSELLVGFRTGLLADVLGGQADPTHRPTNHRSGHLTPVPDEGK